MDLKTLLDAYRERAETALDHYLPPADSEPQRLHMAMRYAALGSGKRVRPVLVYATAAALGVQHNTGLNAPACAVELIHAYSLIHDDLPAMDDDDLRRGRLTCHKAFDEATAILAGDALQSLAFEVLAGDTRLTVDPAVRVRMLQELAHASGSRGMAGGQALDMAGEGRTLPLAQLEQMHRHKTGALIRTAVRLGALCAPGADGPTLQRLDDYGDAMGLAFQIRDDILDVEGDTATLGKPQGSDLQHDKSTYTSLLGADGAREKLHQVHQSALNSLDGLGPDADPLRWLADYVVQRNH